MKTYEEIKLELLDCYPYMTDLQIEDKATVMFNEQFEKPNQK